MTMFSVQESAPLLRRLLRHYEGTKGYDRLLLLLAFCEEPMMSNRDVAKKIKIPESTVRRWKIIYAEQGVPALLSMGEEEKEYFQQLLSLPVAALQLPPATPEKLIAFLNNLPITPNSLQWSADLRNLLIATFDEIDHALVNVVMTVRFRTQKKNTDSGKGKANFVYRLDVFNSTSSSVSAVRHRTPYSGPRWKRLLEEGKRNGFPFEKYHPAIGFDYVRDQDYVGCIVLFRNRNKPIISDSTLQLFEQCRSFITNLFLQHVALLQLENPGVRLFNELDTFIESDPPLTPRENEVLRLLLVGHSYDETADLLFITKSTLISHVRNIYRKTNVTKLSELFGRIFIPNFPLKKGEEKSE